MPAQLIDSFDATAPWSARTPADTPSAEIGLVTVPDLPPGSDGTSSIRLDVSATATGHFIRRAVPPTDLSAFPDLTLWHRSALATTGSPAAPFRLRTELGGAALPVGAVGNDWHRYLHVAQAGEWAHQRLALDDLPVAVRTALDTIVFRVATAGPATSFWLDGLFASEPGIARDADAALLATLDGQLTLAGAPVPATVAAPGFAAPVPPWIRLVQYDAAFGTTRAGTGQRATDFTDEGYRLRDEAQPWDLLYRIDFMTDDRADQAAMVDFVLGRLGRFSRISFGGRVMPVQRIENVPPDDALGPGPVLRYRVAAWAEPDQTRAVATVAEVVTDIDQPGAP